jgi:hypothetical protein
VKSAFELFKDSPFDNLLDWVRALPLITYGVVTKVLDERTVLVNTVVQTGLSREAYTVRLLSLSSALMETSVSPQENDLVLILFLQKYSDAMFADPARRVEDTGTPVLYEKYATGYNAYSGVGLLLRTVKLEAATVIRHILEDGIAKLDLESGADVEAAFHRSFYALFDALGPGDPMPVTAAFGKRFPYTEAHDSTTFRRYGIADVAEEVEQDAAVSEVYSPYAPVSRDYEAAQDTKVGLKTTRDDEGNETFTEVESPVSETVHGTSPITRDIRAPQTTVVGLGDSTTEVDNPLLEREAPIAETVHGKSPLTRDIRSPQTTVVGLGNDENEAPGEEREAPITETVHGKSPITRDLRSPQTTVVGLGNTESENENEEREAPITETIHGKSSITRDIRAPQTTVVGLGNAESENENEEREAPITETVHGKSPIVRDIRSPQTLSVGIGNAESGDESEERDAPVTETYGSKAPITKDIRSPQTFTIGTGPDGPTDAAVTADLDEKAEIVLTSKSGATLHFDKPVSTTLGDIYDLTVTGKITITGEADITIDSGGKIYLGNAAKNLHEVLTGIIDQIEALKTFGSPGMHTVDPSSKAALEAFKRSDIDPFLNTSA